MKMPSLLLGMTQSNEGFYGYGTWFSIHRFLVLVVISMGFSNEVQEVFFLKDWKTEAKE